MTRVDLVYRSGFPWHSKGDCHVKGYAYVEGDRCLGGSELLEYFTASGGFEDFRSRLSKANGMFSVVLNRDGKTWMAVDRMRSFPLFYTGDPRSLMISDSTDRIIGHAGGWKLKQDAAVEFLATGFVTGRETLADGILQVQAGEAAECSGESLSRTLYSGYRTTSVRTEPVEELFGEMEAITHRIAGRLVRSLAGRTAVVALSGGFDSRFVAAMLKNQDYPRVICFSYGREGNPDMKRAEEVAGRLGFTFIPVPYSDPLIGDFVNDVDFRDYVGFSSNRASMFFLQEYFAVRHLREKGRIPGDAVFIPGHSGDFFAGSQLIKHGLPAGKEEMTKTVRRIFDVKYALCRPGRGWRKAMLERIRTSLEEQGTPGRAMPYSIHEEWDLREKLAKFIVNSCNVYAWGGHEYRLPLYDYELQDFFRDLPFLLKSGKKLYDEVLGTRIFGPLGLNFPEELQLDEKAQRKARLRRRVRNLLPEALVPVTVPSRDPICYSEITGALRRDLARRGIRARIHGNSYNSIIVQWYIESLKSELRDAPSLR